MTGEADVTAGPEVVAVSGSSGLLGSAVSKSLRADGVEVRPLVRARPKAGEIGWDPGRGVVDRDALAAVDAVVHLAGEQVGERWTESKKRKILESRVRGTTAVATALAELERPPSVLVSASAVGYYGDRGEELLGEYAERGDDFMADVAHAWEAATRPAEEAGIRVVRLRFGVVLARRGGALAKLLLPFKLGIGGRLGSGRQWMSWISLDDVVGVIRFALDRPELRGVYNAVAPVPVTNREFTRSLGRVLGRPALLAVPTTALRLAYGEMAEVTLLASQRVDSTRLQQAGYNFAHPRVEEALRAQLHR